MFGIGGPELAIILLFGFLIFGPDKLPQIARTVGRGIRQFRSAQEQMNKVIQAEVYDPLKDLEPLANPFAGLSLDDSKNDTKKDTKKVKGDSSKPKTASAAAKKAVDTSKSDKSTDGTSKSDKSTQGPSKIDKAATGEAAVEEKKVSSEAMKAAVSEQAEQTREKAVQDTARKTAAASTTAESFAQRRARLEREHAKTKAEKAEQSEKGEKGE